jgi:hypothetical protein
MAKMDRTIGIGQGAGDEDLAWLGHGARLLDETEVGHYKAPGNLFHPVRLFQDFPGGRKRAAEALERLG